VARASRLAGALVLLQLAAAAPAAAQFYVAYEQGLAAAAAGRWEEALESFLAAERAEPRAQERVRTYGSSFLFAYDPGFHAGRCLAELGRLDEAAARLDAAERAAVTGPDERAALARRIAGLRRPAAPAPAPPAAVAPPVTATSVPPVARARLRIESQPPGAAVRLEGRAVGRTPLALEGLAAGGHQLELELAGHETWRQTVTAVAGETRAYEVALRPRATATATPSAEPVAGPTAAAGPPPERDAAAPAPARSAPPPPVATPTPVPMPPGAATAAAPGGGAPLWPWTAAVAAALAFAAVLRIVRRRRAPPVTLGSGWLRRLPNGGRLGRYRVVSELGRGGMATTFRAVRAGDGLEVALKIPHPSGDPAYLERFLREGRLGETLHHPAIVRILEAGEEEGIPFLAMELIPGETLRARLDRSPEGLPERDALAIARAVAEALDYAHGKGVVHRDLKPENIMLTPGGEAKVMDFGVARVEGQPGLTTSHLFFGSPLYGAPELVEPRTIDRRADLYSLGVVLFEMLEGRPPFVHESVMKLIEMHQRAPLPDPATLPRPLPPSLWSLLAKLLEKDRDARYASAEALLVDLRDALDGARES